MTNSIGDVSFSERVKWRLANPRLFLGSQLKRYRKTSHGFSLKTYDTYQCIFVHVPKCAGSAVVESLFGREAGAPGHLTMSEYIGIFSPSKLNRYFKFTTVRNPWARVVSAYTFLKKGGLNPRDKAWGETYLAPYPNFKSFVKGWLTRENIYKKHHFMPQHHFLLAENHTDLSHFDFVAYVENLEQDFAKITAALGLNQADLLLTNATTRKKHFTEYYDEETKKIVSQVYAKDIHLLGYDFANISLPTLIQTRNQTFPLHKN